MIASVLTKLPKEENKEFVTLIGISRYTRMTFQDFKEKIRDYWRMNIKSSKEDKDNVEIAMSLKKEHKNKKDSVRSIKHEQMNQMFDAFKHWIAQEEHVSQI